MAHIRPWTGWRPLAYATAIGIVGAITVAPQPAWAAVTVKAKVDASIEISLPSCTEFVYVYTSATFVPNATEDTVMVSFGGLGAPPGRAGFGDGGGGDEFDWNFPTAGLVPGVELTVKADWEAHTGNGLSRGFATASDTVTVPLPPPARKYDRLLKCAFEDESRTHARIARDLRAAAKAVQPCAACHDLLIVLAQNQEASAALEHRLALDPPDPNFTVLPTAVAPLAPTVLAGAGVTAQVASAANDYLHLMADVIAESRAALQAVERAQGARVAHDSTWERRQSMAAADSLKSMATRLAGLPASRSRLGAAMHAGGFPNPTITDTDRAAVVFDSLGSGPPNPDWLRQQVGLTDDQLAQIGALFARADEVTNGPSPVLDSFDDAALAEADAALVTALNDSVAALIANPLVDFTEQNGTPSPSLSSSHTTPGPMVSEGASLLGNSGFETPALPAGTAFQTLSAGKAPGLGAWTIQKGSIDVVASPGAQAATGGQFIDLNGNDTANGGGVITQSVPVTSGHRYRLSFQLAGNPNGDPRQKTIQVSLGSTVQTFTFDTTGHTNDNLGWTTHSIEADAHGQESMTVTFASTTEGSRGPNLDNVVLTDIGAASSGFPLWLIALIALVVVVAAVVVVLYLRRRRHAASSQPATDT